jgi:hypothetical protein
MLAIIFVVPMNYCAISSRGLMYRPCIHLVSKWLAAEENNITVNSEYITFLLLFILSLLPFLVSSDSFIFIMPMQSLFKAAICLGLLSVSTAGPTFSERTTFSAEDTITVDVAIIGGGATGTYAAVRLQDYGKSVLVIEKSGRLGGHTETYFATDAPPPFTGAPVDYGVQAVRTPGRNSSFISAYLWADE